jgi:signal transduction histidine kinase
MRPSTPVRVRTVLVEDLFLAVGVTVVLLIGSGVSLEDDFEIDLAGDAAGPWVPGPDALALVLLGALPLTFRRLAPLSVFALCASASMAYQALGNRPEPLPLGVLVALYTLATVRRPLVCNAAAGVHVTLFTLAGMTGVLPLSDDQYFIDLVSAIATVTLGYGVALGRARATLAEQRAAELIQEQDARTRAALAQEQGRIAREVHDIVAHDVSVMVAQAGAGRRVFAARPETAADAFASIEAVGRDALDGLRRIVTLLRTDLGNVERSPQPGLERLPWLVGQVRRAGLPTDLIVRGRPRSLPATVELNAFRVVQEALTNILKHAGPTSATVVLAYGEDRLDIEVRDRGVGVSGTPSAGYGLISMQQRAAMLGGVLVAGPGEDGFVVSASLPVAGYPQERHRDAPPPDDAGPRPAHPLPRPRAAEPIP